MTLLSSDGRLLFGNKHRDELIDDVINTDLDYCLWMREQEEVINDNELYSKLKPLVKKSLCMPWGKYKNIEISAVANKDKKYLQWVLNSGYASRKNGIYYEIQKYVM